MQAYLEESGQASTVEVVISQDTADMTASIIAAAAGTLVLDRAGEAASALNIVALLAETKSSLLLRN